MVLAVEPDSTRKYQADGQFPRLRSVCERKVHSQIGLQRLPDVRDKLLNS